MRKDLKSYIFLITFIFLFISLTDALFMESGSLVQIASARPREFEENFVILSNELQVLELVFSEGEELELIFTMEVKQNLPVDIWFVNYANYVRYVDGREFLYFIDGSGQDLMQATKVVTVTQHDTYELVFANYNNVTVEVYLAYDINVLDITPPSSPAQVTTESKDESEITIRWQANTESDLDGYIIQRSASHDGPFANMTKLEKDAISYTDIGLDSGKTYYYRVIAIDTAENPSEPSTVISATTEEIPVWQTVTFLAPIVLVIGILIGIIVSRIFRNKVEKEAIEEQPSKEAKKRKAKLGVPEEEPPKKVEKRKVKKKPKKPQKGPSEELEAEESKKEPEVEKAFSPGFCGHCGKPVETPFCVFCGKAVKEPSIALEEGASEI